jgi:HemY protein
MLRILFFVLLAAATLALAWWLAGLPGTVSVTLAGYSIQTATSLAIVAVVVLVVVLVLALRTLGWIVSVPRRLSVRSARRRRAGGDEAITRTLVAIAAGDEGDAWREAARARRLLGDTPQTLLLAAEAGRLAKREDDATALYNMLAKRDDAALLGLRGLFRQAMNREAWGEAAALANRADEVHPGGAWLRDERAQLAVRTGNWAQALRLAGPDAPRAAFATAASEAESDAAEALRLAKLAAKADPGFTPAALAYAKRLRASGRDLKAFDVVREAWRAAPQPDLAAFWLAPFEDPAMRVREARRIVSTNPDSAESHFLMARVALEAGELEEARRHLDLAKAAGMNERRMWLLLADLAAAEHGETEAGREAQRDALRHAASAEPDAQWRCESCGTTYATWQPACHVCHTAGRIRWGTVRLALPAS